MAHRDDDDNPCDCEAQEAVVVESTSTEDEDIVVCPECGSTDHSLTCGDHGCRCNACDATFTVC